jgi:hypothetical protein
MYEMLIGELGEVELCPSPVCTERNPYHKILIANVIHLGQGCSKSSPSWKDKGNSGGRLA